MLHPPRGEPERDRHDHHGADDRRGVAQPRQEIGDVIHRRRAAVLERLVDAVLLADEPRVLDDLGEQQAEADQQGQ